MADIDITRGLFKIEVSIRQLTGPEPLVQQKSDIPLAPPAGRKGPCPPLIHAFATHLSDANKVGLDNVSYWGTGLRRLNHYHLNKALEKHLDLLKSDICQIIGSEPLVSKKTPRASRAGRKSPCLPLIHAFATRLRDANKVGLDNLAYWSTGPEGAMDYLVNEALAHYLPGCRGYSNSERLSSPAKRTKVK